jgi:hypothetical protein
MSNKPIVKDNKFRSVLHGLLSNMYADDVTLIHVYNSSTPFGGYTIAWSYAFPGSRMVGVSVTYCDKEDSYDQEIGAILTLNRFYRGEIIQLPFGEMGSKDAINQKLIDMFNNF